MNHSLWNSSAQKLRSTRYLAIMATTIAMKVVMSYWYIPVGENLRAGLSFLLVALEASILGPAAGMVSGFVTDLVGYIIAPSGMFFIGYTVTAMAGSLIYALFLYQRKITFVRLLLAKAVINYGVNVLMGSLWSAMLYSRGYWFYFAKSLLKNTILLPFEAAALYALFRFLSPYLIRRGLMDPSCRMDSR
jgi:ECF transporter S component (folate family)